MGNQQRIIYWSWRKITSYDNLEAYDIYKKSGIYQAINYGIKKCSGDYITILNSDDFYHSNNTINNVVNHINKNKEVKIFSGNVVYFKKLQYYDITRYYNVTNFKVSQMILRFLNKK